MEPPPVNYGWSIIGRLGPGLPGVFLSGLEWRSGRLCRILPKRGPRRPGDWVPVWATRAEALHMLSTISCPPSEFHVTHWEVIDVTATITSGGPLSRNTSHRGVNGHTIPEKPRDPLLEKAGRPIPHPHPHPHPTPKPNNGCNISRLKA